MWYDPLLENGLLPDIAVRAGIRGQLRARLRAQRSSSSQGALEKFVEELRRGPIATHTAATGMPLPMALNDWIFTIEDRRGCPPADVSRPHRPHADAPPLERQRLVHVQVDDHAE